MRAAAQAHILGGVAHACIPSGVGAGASIPEHFEPGPTRPASPARTRLAHESYSTGVGRDREAREFFFGPSPAQNAVFSCFTLKCAGGPPKPGPGLKIKARPVQ
jgi:hypothetical protein